LGLKNEPRDKLDLRPDGAFPTPLKIWRESRKCETSSRKLVINT
jgi:hypothetical protein